jgi:hypothetical protein
VTQRVDARLRRDLRSLFPTEPKRGARLSSPPVKVSIGASRGLAVAKKTAGAASGGIASPLIETDIDARTYHAGKYWSTSDGMILWPAIDAVVFTDANGAEVVQRYASPE